MKRNNVISLLLQMVPSSMHASSSSALADHWNFLEEIDAPQYVDLIEEAALVGVQGNDPWFYQSHSHHETSLARGAKVQLSGKTSTMEKSKPHAKIKSSVPKIIKPSSLTANAMKACLGGAQRGSSMGSKEGRFSSRPSAAGRPRPRTPRRGNVNRAAVQSKPPFSGSVPRTDVGTPTDKKSSVEKPAHLRSANPPHSKTEEPTTGLCPGRRSNAKSGNVQSSLRLYRLPAPPSGAQCGSPTSSPSDMNFSSDSSPTTSNSSQGFSRDFIHSVCTSATSNRRGPADDEAGDDGGALGRTSTSLSVQMPKVQERDAPVLSLRAMNRDFSSNGGKNNFTPDVKQRASSPRLKRRSIGSKRAVVAVRNSKKSSSKLTDHRSEREPEKVVATHPTHPILERLRKSWGSALRVKQTRDEGDAVDNSEVEGGTQNSPGSDQNTKRRLYSAKEDVVGKRNDKGRTQSEVLKSGQSRGAVIQSSHGPPLASPARMMTLPKQRDLRVTTSVALSKSKPTGAANGKKNAHSTPAIDLSKGQSINQSSLKSESSMKFKKQYGYTDYGIKRSLSMRANKENIHTEMPDKPTPASTSGQELKSKMQTTGLKSNIRTPSRQLALGRSPLASPAHLARGSPQAYRTSPQTGTGPRPPNPANNKADVGRPARAGGKSASYSYGLRSESALSFLGGETKRIAVYQDSPLSSPKLTKRKPVSTSHAGIKGDTAIAGRTGTHNADESVIMTTEDRKSRAAPKYEPRIHSQKAIKEWETKSGRKYYDLQPLERQKVNQQITAAAKRREAK